MPKKNMPAINAIWNISYSDAEKKEKSKKVSFKVEKNNTKDVCTCANISALSCQLHDGSHENNAKYFKLIKKYFAEYLTFDEKDAIDGAQGDYDTVSYFLKSTLDTIERLKKRKKEVFEEELSKCFNKRIMIDSTPRVVEMEDFDPEWNRFLAKWDNIMFDMASAKKQQKFIRTSLVKGGARGLDGTVLYNNIPHMEKLVCLLENAQELIFMDFLMV